VHAFGLGLTKFTFIISFAACMRMVFNQYSSLSLSSDLNIALSSGGSSDARDYPLYYHIIRQDCAVFHCFVTTVFDSKHWHTTPTLIHFIFFPLISSAMLGNRTSQNARASAASDKQIWCRDMQCSIIGHIPTLAEYLQLALSLFSTSWCAFPLTHGLDNRLRKVQ